MEKLKVQLFDVIGAIYEVHKELGAGLSETCYQEGLSIELTERGIPFMREMSFHPTYHGKALDSSFRIDFLCKDSIIIECKAVNEIVSNHRAQLFNYMRLLKKPCGILVNFSPKFAVVERYFYDDEQKEILSVNGCLIRKV